MFLIREKLISSAMASLVLPRPFPLQWTTSSFRYFSSQRHTSSAMASLLLSRSFSLHSSLRFLSPTTLAFPKRFLASHFPSACLSTDSAAPSTDSLPTVDSSTPSTQSSPTSPAVFSNRSAVPVSLVAGASRGIGLEFTRQLLVKHPESPVVAACRTPDAAENLQALKEKHPSQLTILRIDVTDEETVQEVAKELSEKFGRLDLLINTVGVLHIPNVMQPETGLQKVERKTLLRAYKINAVGPIIVCKHMMPLLKLGLGEGTGRGGAVIANISAKIGSIRDNQLGGWYAYRSSKAGLNQFTRTLGVECLRRKEPIICVSLHPGTVDTELSKPYSRGIPPEKLFTPEASVDKLLAIIDSLKMEDAAKFFSYDRQEIPW